MTRAQRPVLVVAGVSVALAALACNAPGLERMPDVAPTPFLAPTFTPSSTTVLPRSGTALPRTTPLPETPATRPPLTTDTLIDFETWGTWRRGDQPYGTFEQSGEQVYGGQFAGRLQYEFPTSGNDFVVFLHPTPIAGTPDRAQAWVYGDASGHFLNVWVRDVEGEVWQATFGRVEHTGWHHMTAEIRMGQDWPWGHISGPEDGTLDFPIDFYALVLDDGDDAFIGSGTIFVDELAVR